MGPKLEHTGVLDALIRQPTHTRCKPPGEAMYANALPNTPRGWRSSAPKRSSKHWMPRPWSCPAPALRPPLCPCWPPNLLSSMPSEPWSYPRWKRWLLPTLFPPVLTFMPGVGVRTAARLLTEVVGKEFKTAGHVASYAGIAPHHTALGDQYSQRILQPRRQQTPQIRPVQQRLRLTRPPAITPVLGQETL